MSFWTLRWAAYSSVTHDPSTWKILGWDIGRVVVWATLFVVGSSAHSAFVTEDMTKSLRFMIAIATFGTFLASFVLSVMTTTGKRELGLMQDATSVRQMKERLQWLLSDQLIMVVSALLTAASSLTWLGIAAVGYSPCHLLTATVIAFGGLAIFNALRLPFQIWELQSSALNEEQQRAYERLNKETMERFGK